jgi:putative chitinase
MAELYEVIPEGLNLRASPGDGAVITVMTRGQVVEKIGDSDRPGWWKLHVSVAKLEEEGFASAAHLKALDPKRPFSIPFLGNLQASFKRVQAFVGPYANKFSADILPQLNKTLSAYGINKNSKRFTHFLAQVAHESTHFSRLEENLKYSAEGLWATFRKYFKDEAECALYARQPEKIANHVYCNRNGNGDEASGDGWKYRGRGFIQLTGRANYKEIGDKIGVDLENNPDLLITDVGIALKASCAFWEARGLNALADKDDIRAITRAINGGYNGLADRQQLLDRAKAIWG